MPPLDHLPAFTTACSSTLLNSCNEVATARTSWALTFPGTLAILKCGMRIRYSGADQTRDRGCSELLPRIVVLE